jgi:GMP synthase-like glutamine amidotransferase
VTDSALRVAVYQHIVCEPPGVFEDVMREHGWEILRAELDEGEPLPAPDEFDVLVVMGGPMGAYEHDRYGWLGPELESVANAARSGKPVFGACLGSQLLAASLGGRAYAGERPEIGVLDVELTEAGREDPVTGALPERFPTLQWHGDTFDLPEGAVRLAGSPAYENQAFRHGDLTYAVQFHIEVTAEMAAEWGRVPAYAAALEAVSGPGSLDRLLAEFADRQTEMSGHARTLFERWVAVAEQSLRPGLSS